MAHAVADFFDVGDHETLAGFDGVDEVGGLEHGFGGAGIEPCESATECGDVEGSGFEIDAVEIGDFEFASGGRLKIFGVFDDFVIVKVEAGYSEI